MNRIQKYAVWFGCFFGAIFLYCCTTSKKLHVEKSDSKNDTVRIANDSIEYEVIIIEPGFNGWLQRAAPRGFYSQSYLEARNRIWVQEWNIRAISPQFSRDYLMQIDYSPSINYGYEVNYLLFNYLTYFQIKYNQNLGLYFPRQ